MSELIQHAYDCPIRKYMDFAFMERRNALTLSGEPTEEEINAAFEQIEEEFSDCMSGETGFMQESFSLLNIIRTQQRITIFETCMAMQKTFIEAWNEPFKEGLSFINENFASGRNRLQWPGDVEEFKQKLFFVEANFKVWYLYLSEDKANYDRELKERREKRGSTPATTKQHDLTSFLSLLNSMKTQGFSFDKEKDSLAELGVAVKMLMERKPATTE